MLTFRNVHNFDEAGRMLMHRQAFEALKSGGIYGIVDHTRRHMEPDNNENRRRIDPVLEDAEDCKVKRLVERMRRSDEWRGLV